MQIPCHLWRRGKEWGTELDKIARCWCSVIPVSGTGHIKWVEQKEQNFRLQGCLAWGLLQASGRGSYSAPSHMGLECCQLSVHGRKGLLGTHIPGPPQSPLVHGLYRSLCASVWAQRIGGLVTLAQDTEVTVCWDFKTRYKWPVPWNPVIRTV